jgi:CRISPR-associated protein Csy3
METFMCDCIKNNMPATSSVCQSIIPSKAYLFSVFEDGSKKPVIVECNSVLGTHGSFTSEKEKMKEISDGKMGNPQQVDTVYLDATAKWLSIEGSIRICDWSTEFHSCKNGEKAEKRLEEQLPVLIKLFYEKGGYNYLAQRYVTQIINGSMGFKNKYAHESYIEIDLEFSNKIKNENSVHTMKFDCNKKYSMDDKDFATFVSLFELALYNQFCFLDIEYKIYFRHSRGAKVYPSQEMDLDSGSKKSKTLSTSDYQGIKNVAIMHDVKIGNAIRTIDTWYSEYDETKPILPINPYAPNKTEGNRAYRAPGSGECFYDFFTNMDRLIEKLKEAKNCDEIPKNCFYFVAMLIRGGVFTKKK